MFASRKSITKLFRVADGIHAYIKKDFVNGTAPAYQELNQSQGEIPLVKPESIASHNCEIFLAFLYERKQQNDLVIHRVSFIGMGLDVITAPAYQELNQSQRTIPLVKPTSIDFHNTARAQRLRADY